MRPAPKPASNMWLVGFTDVVALMLTFFVMTYSMANPKQEVWDELRSQVNMEFSKTLGQVAQRGEVNDISLERISFEHALGISYLEALLTNQLTERNLTDRVFLINDETQKRLILTIPSNALFSSGSADISSGNNDLITSLADILNGIHNSIEIVGHTDPTPVSKTSSEYLSNWDLSLRRALNISTIFKESGYKHPIHVRGGADGLYHSLPTSIPNVNRMVMSRRVDIILYDTKEDFKDRILTSAK